MADPFATLAGAPAFSRGGTRVPNPTPEEDEEQEQSLLSQIGYGTLSGIEKLGNVLDLPGSMLRDVAVMDNPFDQLLSPLSHTNNKGSSGGRDVLARNVFTSWLFTPNKETGFVPLEDPLEFIQDVAGFGVEMAMDPLAIFTGWAKGAGKLAKAATKVDDVVDGAKAAGAAVDTGGALAKRAVEKTFDAATSTLDEFIDDYMKGAIPRDGSPLAKQYEQFAANNAAEINDRLRKMYEATDPLKKAGDTVVESAPVPKSESTIKRAWGATKRGMNAINRGMDYIDPGQRVGQGLRHLYDTNDSVRSALDSIKPALSALGSKPISAVRARVEKIREARTAANVFGPNETRFRNQAREKWGEQGEEFVKVVRSFASVWSDAQKADIDDFFDRSFDQIIDSSIGQVSDDALRQDVWHGTPHNWEPEPGFPYGRPRLDKMLTGEGTKDQIWGWYSADTEAMGEFYRKFIGSKKGMAEAFKKFANPGESELEFAMRFEKDPKQFGMQDGSLMKFDLPDEDLPRLIDLDRPLAEQSDYVKQKIQPLIDELNAKVQAVHDAGPDQKWLDQYGPGGKQEQWFRSKYPDQEYQPVQWTPKGASFIDPSKVTGKEFLRTELKKRLNLDPKQVSELLNQYGVVGARHHEPGIKMSFGLDATLDDGSLVGAADNFIVWNQDVLDRTALLEKNGKKIAAANNILFQAPEYRSEPFYSKIMEAVDAGKIPNKVGRDQLLKTLTGYGVKQEELTDMASELDTLFAASKDGKISKDDIRKLASAAATKDIQFEELPADQVRYSKFRIPGGDDGSYREMVVRHPKAVWDAEHKHFRNISDQMSFAQYDTVTLPDGTRALRIGAIQSDLHQRGAKHGYDGPGWVPPDADLHTGEDFSDTEIRQFRASDGTTRWDLFNPVKWDDATGDPIEWDHFTAGYDTEAEAYEALDAVRASLDTSPPPNQAPFKKSWHELTLKAVLRRAVEMGHDKVLLPRGADIATAAEAFLRPDKLASWYDNKIKNTLKKLVGNTEGSTEQTAAGIIFHLSPKFRDKVLQKGQPLYQQARGAVAFDPETGKATIHAFSNSDLSTFVHETAHIFRRFLADIDPDLLVRARKGVNVEGMEWSREAEEEFARGFEDYMRSGNAPTRELRSVFAKMKRWLTEIYETIMGTDPGKVSDELKSVFDEMLGKNRKTEPGDRVNEFLNGALDILEGTGRQMSGVAGATKRTFLKLMDPTVRGRSSELMQAAARLQTATEEEVIQESSQAVTAVFDAITKEVGYRPGSVDVPAGVAPHAMLMDDLVHAIEIDDFDALPQSLVAPAQQLKLTLQELQRRMVSLGHVREELQDLYVDFFPHDVNPTLEAWLQATEFRLTGPGNAATDAAVNQRASQSARDDLFRNAAAGRRTWNSLTTDPEVLKHFAEFNSIDMDPLIRHERMQAAIEAIKDRYGSEIDPRMPKMKSNGYEDLVTLVDETGTEIDIPISELNGMYSRMKSRHDLKTAPGRLQEHQDPILYELTADAVLNPGQGKKFALKLSDKSRYDGLADWMSDKYDLLVGGKGIFSGEPLSSVQERIFRDAHTIGALKALPEILSGAFNSRLISTSDTIKGGVPLSKVMGSALFSRVRRNRVYDTVADQNPSVRAIRDIYHRNNTPEQFYEHMDRLHVSRDLSDEILASADLLQKGSTLFDPVLKAFRGATAAFKVGVLTHPARYIRDLSSATAALVYGDRVSGDSMAEGFRTFFNRPSKLMGQVPAVQAWLAKYGMENTPENVTRALHQMYATLKGHGLSVYKDPNLDELPLGAQIQQGLLGIEAAFPGTGITNFGSPLQSTKRILSAGGPQRMWRQLKTEREAGFFGDAGKQVSRAWQSGTWNPFDIQGIPHVFITESKRKAGIKRGDVRTSSDFKFAKVGDVVGKNVDDFPRFVGFLEGLLRGEKPEQAFKEVTRLLLDYDPRSFGPLETKFLKKLFPFYSFLRQQSVYMAHELYTNPAGRLGKLIRVARLSQPHNEYLPEHVREGIAIPSPFGFEKKDGTKNYLTGLGLMFEDPPKILFPDSAQDLARSVLSRTNPLIKGVAELGLGRSSFQSGALGSRDLADMDPVLGRIMTNVGLKDPLPGGQAEPAFGSRTLEFFLSNSPVSRLLTTAKTLTEDSDRKNVREKVMNTLTGAKITSVSPQVQQRGLRDIVNAIAKELGTRPFTTFTVSQEMIDDAIASGDEEKVQTLLMIKELREIWDRRRRREKKAQKKQPPTAADLLIGG